MLFPTLAPHVFVGRNLEPSDVGVVYFQDLGSYRQGTRYDSLRNDSDGVLWRGSESEISHIFNYESALDQLMVCALRRRERGN
jgi:hypothetical protein